MAAKEKIKGSVLKAVKISQLISANNLIGSRLEKNSEQSQIYHQTVVPKIDEFKQEFSGRGPQRVLEDLLRNYVLNKGIDENYETQGFAYFGRILHSHCWAAITRKDPSIPLMKTTVYPQLYILVNKDGIRFGFDYGFNVEPDSIFVTRVKSNPEMGNQILRLVSNPINLLPCSGLEAKDGPDPGKALEISGLDDVNQKWSNRVSLIRNFSENDIPDDIETKVTETFDLLFDFFDTLSNVTHPRLSKGEVATVEQLSERTYLPIGFFKNLESLLIEKGQIILYGPPGTGKTFVAEEFALYFAGNKERVTRVQFHPAYSYEDFVEGLKPKLTDGELAYDVVPGPFKQFCMKAAETPERYVFIIDEINRGTMAKVFGELIYCLEYRNHEITLPYSPERQFKIPSNLYIVATMNSADRSIALVDYALRRRFYFQELQPDMNILSKYLIAENCAVDIDTLIRFLKKINEKIEQKLGREYTIGHSYFMIKDLSKEKINRVWKYAILPLLEEYFFNNKSELEEFAKDFADFSANL